MIVVDDMMNRDVPGQSASLRVAVRQGILTRLLKQPNLIDSSRNSTLQRDKLNFCKYFPGKGLDIFLCQIRKDFQSTTAIPTFKPKTKRINSPYAGYLLEFATPEQRKYFDLNLVRENSEAPRRVFPHGHPMFSADLKKYVDGRKDELNIFMNRLYDSNQRYSCVNEWIPESAVESVTGIPFNTPLHYTSSSPESKAEVSSNSQVNWTEEMAAAVNEYSNEDVQENIRMLPVGDLLKEKMLKVEMNGELFICVTEVAEFVALFKMSAKEASDVIKAINLTSIVEVLVEEQEN